MTPEEQFEVINEPGYFNKLKAKINAIRSAMSSVEASASEIKTQVDGIPIVVAFRPDSQEGTVSVGEDAQGQALYGWTFPIRWLEEVA